MWGNNSYTITIINDTGSGEMKATASNQSNDGKTEDKLPKQLTGMAMLGYAKNIANRVIQSNINTVALRTGHEELQQKQQFIYNTINRGLNIATSIAIGAKTGGAWGAVAGAVIGVASTGIDIAIKQNEINIARGQENTSIFLNQIRIGAGGGRMGRTE
jgi:hypothetical protein